MYLARLGEAVPLAFPSLIRKCTQPRFFQIKSQLIRLWSSSSRTCFVGKHLSHYLSPIKSEGRCQGDERLYASLKRKKKNGDGE